MSVLRHAKLGMPVVLAAALLCLPVGASLASGQERQPANQDTAARSTTAEPAPVAPVRQYPAAGFSWSGLYIGGMAGIAQAKSEASSTVEYSPIGYFAQSSVTAIAAVGRQNLDHEKPTFGGQAGFSLQAGSLVIGGEADYQRMKLQGSASTTAGYPCCAPTTFTLNEAIDTTYLATARGRIGLATGRLLIFGTAGVAMTDLNYQGTFSDTYASMIENGGVDQRQDALVYGGGIEIRGGSRWSVKAEFLRADFGTVSTTSNNLRNSAGAFDEPNSVFTHEASLVLNTLRGVLVIRF